MNFMRLIGEALLHCGCCQNANEGPLYPGKPTSHQLLLLPHTGRLINLSLPTPARAKATISSATELIFSRLYLPAKWGSFFWACHFSICLIVPGWVGSGRLLLLPGKEGKRDRTWTCQKILLSATNEGEFSRKACTEMTYSILILILRTGHAKVVIKSASQPRISPFSWAVSDQSEAWTVILAPEQLISWIRIKLQY